jgi:hypothetical protein
VSIISAEGKARLKERISAEVRSSMVRPSYASQIPLPAEHLAARAEFVTKWEAMCKEGEKLNYLEWTNDYDGSHLVPVTATTTIGPRAFYETDEQWEQKIRAEINRRVKDEIARVVRTVNGVES